MTMTSTRLRHKRKNARDAATMIATLLCVVLGVTWVEWHLFDSVAPWIRIVAITFGWIGLATIILFSLLRKKV